MDKLVTVELDVRSAAAIRQILFEHQKGYTYDESSVPPRISDIRVVIRELDKGIGSVVES
jgi:hypothetical protein